MEIEVAVPSPVPGSFTYTASHPISPGTRVLVPFGRQKLVGVTVEIAANDKKSSEIRTLKAIIEVLDEAPVFSKDMLRLAHWMADYYLHPIGEVLKSMLPGSTIKSKKIDYRLAPPPLSGDPNSDPPRAELAAMFGKRVSLSHTVLMKKLAKIDGASPEASPESSIIRYMKLGLLTVERQNQVKTRGIGAGPQDENFSSPLGSAASQLPCTDGPPMQLTECQMKATAAISAATSHGDREKRAPKPILLFGITGSGKTELYLRAIASLTDPHRQIGSRAKQKGPPQTLLLVPEISLTPQMSRVFEARFPGLVAMVHSAMGDDQRWEQLQKIRDSSATILIGPRSAVFAPFANLQLVIVDEEHDGSYKQGSGLHYHGRDVAIMRAQLESCVTLLGSATPSLESFYNALNGKYELVELVERASPRGLPDIRCVASKRTFSEGAVVAALQHDTSYHSSYWPKEIESVPVPIDPEIIEELRSNLTQGMQSIVLVNRRGYAFFLYSPARKETIRCPQCAISMTLHKKSSSLRCHYCDFKEPIVQALKRHPDDRFVAIGYGSEKTEESLRNLLPTARIERLDSDTAANRDVLSDTLERFRKREIDILVGTQILAKGHDFPGVTLVAVLDVDQSLNLPDFRAGERAFQLIVQSAGRAGRGEHPGRVLLQCAKAGHPVIACAANQDYRSFASFELGFRQAHSYPPFSKMIAVEFNSEDKGAVDKLKSHLETWAQRLQSSRTDLRGKIRFLGPTAPPLELVRGRHRLHVILSSPDRGVLWPVTRALCEDFKKLPANVRMLVDVDPQSLL